MADYKASLAISTFGHENWTILLGSGIQPGIYDMEEFVELYGMVLCPGAVQQ